MLIDFVRIRLIIFSALFMTVAQSWALESDLFIIHQFAVSHSSPVSFSIEYPKGWRVTQELKSHSGEYLAADGFWVCAFWPTNIFPTNFAGFTIFRSGGVTAQEAVDTFSVISSRNGTYTKKGLSSVKTNAGDSGYLLESEANFDNVNTSTNLPKFTNAVNNVQVIKLGQVVLQDFFFHSGNKGSIRIEILTRKTDSSFRSELDEMVLNTLRFDGD